MFLVSFIMNYMTASIKHNMRDQDIKFYRARDINKIALSDTRSYLLMCMINLTSRYRSRLLHIWILKW